MKLSRHQPAQLFKIKQPRWRDRSVLLACYKIGTHNEIVFTEAKSMPDHYYIAGSKASKYPQASNGALQCYVIPLDDLEILERVDD